MCSSLVDLPAKMARAQAESGLSSERVASLNAAHDRAGRHTVTSAERGCTLRTQSTPDMIF